MFILRFQNEPYVHIESVFNIAIHCQLPTRKKSPQSTKASGTREAQQCSHCMRYLITAPSLDNWKPPVIFRETSHEPSSSYARMPHACRKCIEPNELEFIKSQNKAIFNKVWCCLRAKGNKCQSWNVFRVIARVILLNLCLATTRFYQRFHIF